MRAVDCRLLTVDSVVPRSRQPYALHHPVLRGAAGFEVDHGDRVAHEAGDVRGRRVGWWEYDGGRAGAGFDHRDHGRQIRIDDVDLTALEAGDEDAGPSAGVVETHFI